jgi:hypothetical protein
MNDDPVDFSSLDPRRDEVRWERMVQGVVAQAVKARARPGPVWVGLATSGTRILAAAAAVAVIAWAPALWSRVTAGSWPRLNATAASHDPARSLADWAERDQLPSNSELASAMGDLYGRR